MMDAMPSSGIRVVEFEYFEVRKNKRPLVQQPQVWLLQQSASGDEGPFEIIDIEGIDGLIGMLKADERSRQWWILNRENQATFDLVVRDEYVNN